MGTLKRLLREKDDCPVITFFRHEDVSAAEGEMTSELASDKQQLQPQQLIVERRLSFPGALRPDQLGEYFISKLIRDDDRLSEAFQGELFDRLPGLSRIPSSYEEYVTVLAPILAGVNPFCRFTNVLTPCFQRRNKQKDKSAVRLLSLKLGCEVPGCTVAVNILISVRNGDVFLCFKNKKTPVDLKKDESVLVDANKDMADDSDEERKMKKGEMVSSR